MVERKEVEALLAKAQRPVTTYQVQTSVSLNTLATLCRAWLAVQEAPVGVVDVLTGWEDGSGAVEVHYERGRPSDLTRKQRVRIVKEVG